MSDGFCGIVLAAGAGTRFGGPKALAATDGVAWLELVVTTLRDGGCDDVLVVLGAEAERAADLVPGSARIVVASDWATGVSASLRAGLRAAGTMTARAAVIVPVDTPGLPSAAVERVIASVGDDLEDALAQATYLGDPGHPVVIGRDHWPAVAASIAGDVGARPFLRRHGAVLVECGDLWSGADVDARD